MLCDEWKLGSVSDKLVYDPLAEDIDQAERLDEYLGLVASTEKIEA
jgi:hypothetical protein